MKNHVRLFSAILPVIFALTYTSCNKNQDEPVPLDPVDIELTADQVTMINTGNEFAFDIFKKITLNTEDSENIIISPLSISTALSMTANGAQGETREDIMEALKLSGLSAEVLNESYRDLIKTLLSVDSRVAISVANSVWTREGFAAKKQFMDALINFYNATTGTFDPNDPQSVTEINTWISDNTNGLIRDMLDEIHPDAMMLLINAIYFKGQWNSRFDESQTVSETFYITGGTEVRVPMMKQKQRFRIHSGDGFLLAEFPYGQGNYVMDVILPDEVDGINNIISSLTNESFNQMIGGLHDAEIELSFPRFKYGFRTELNEILQLMGMDLPFSDAADFTGISDLPLKISRVLHEAFIETNEEGTEAAAVTVVEFVATSIQPSTLVVKLDHPFMYIIRESSTNSVIFMGRVSDPLGE